MNTTMRKTQPKIQRETVAGRVLLKVQSLRCMMTGCHDRKVFHYSTMVRSVQGSIFSEWTLPIATPHHHTATVGWRAYAIPRPMGSQAPPLSGHQAGRVTHRYCSFLLQSANESTD